MNIKITADSTCDLNEELLQRYDITLTPLYVIKDGQAFRDGVDIHPADIFAHVAAGGKLCSTSAVAVDDYRECFGKVSPDYDAVIHITIGSGFSACYQNASIAAAQFKNVYVVDSMNLSSGQGHLVIEAAQLAASGMSPMEICSTLNAMRSRVESSFILDQLAYMQKGGRCSSATALGANLLKIKPCIEVKDGAMGVVEKYRGHLEKCLEKYAKDRLKDRTDLRFDRVFITHSEIDQAIVDATRELLQKYCSFDEIHEAIAGCTISCHCGPKTLGIMLLKK